MRDHQLTIQTRATTTTTTKLLTVWPQRYLKLEFRVHCGYMKLGNWYHSQAVSFQL